MATTSDIREFDFRTNNTSHIAPLTSFLSLVPTTSYSYSSLLAKIRSATVPQPSPVDAATIPLPEDEVAVVESAVEDAVVLESAVEEAVIVEESAVEDAVDDTATQVVPVDAVPVAVIVDQSLAHRRSSSMTSTGSAASVKRRFLRLCPVHGGEDARDADWSEVIE